MDRQRQIVRILFATGIMSVGVLLFAYGYPVLVFQEVPATWGGWLTPVAYASGLLLLASGIGLLFDRTSRPATRVLLPFLLLWLVSRVTVVVGDPLREISWFAIGEVAVPFAAALVISSWYRWATSPTFVARSRTLARLLVGPSLVTFGLSHFFEFAARTISLVPPWLPYPALWADLAGAAQVAAGLGVLFAFYPRWAAAAQAAMLTTFAALVWVPAVISAPGLQSNWVEFLYTWALAASCWVVAVELPANRPA